MDQTELHRWVLTLVLAEHVIWVLDLQWDVANSQLLAAGVSCLHGGNYCRLCRLVTLALNHLPEPDCCGQNVLYYVTHRNEIPAGVPATEPFLSSKHIHA